MAYRIKQNNGTFRVTDSSDSEIELGLPAVAVAAQVTAKHVQFGPFCVTTLTLNNVPQTVVNGTEHQGTKIYDFPQCRLSVLGVTATLQQKTTSAIASTLNSGSTGAIAMGALGSRTGLGIETGIAASGGATVCGATLRGARSIRGAGASPL